MQIILNLLKNKIVIASPRKKNRKDFYIKLAICNNHSKRGTKWDIKRSQLLLNKLSKKSDNKQDNSKKAPLFDLITKQILKQLPRKCNDAYLS